MIQIVFFLFFCSGHQRPHSDGSTDIMRQPDIHTQYHGKVMNIHATCISSYQSEYSWYILSVWIFMVYLISLNIHGISYQSEYSWYILSVWIFMVYLISLNIHGISYQSEYSWYILSVWIFMVYLISLNIHGISYQSEYSWYILSVWIFMVYLISLNIHGISYQSEYSWYILSVWIFMVYLISLNIHGISYQSALVKLLTFSFLDWWYEIFVCLCHSNFEEQILTFLISKLWMLCNILLCDTSEIICRTGNYSPGKMWGSHVVSSAEFFQNNLGKIINVLWVCYCVNFITGLSEKYLKTYLHHGVAILFFLPFKSMWPNRGWKGK